MTKQHNLQNNAIVNSFEVDNLKWNELRQTVKQYGLSTSGKKIDLQQRLKNYFLEGQQHSREEAAAAAHEKETRPETTDAEGKAEAVEKHDDATTPGLTSEQRRRMEENRKRALEIRQKLHR